MTKQWKVCFAVEEKNFLRQKELKKSFNISEKLREAYNKILDEAGV